MTIGVDIGGSKIRGILWNGKKIVRSFEIKTPKSLEKFKSTLKLLFKNLNASGSVKKIGISIAGVVSSTKVISTSNIPYLKNYNLKSLISNFQPLTSVVVDNDARCFARAEYELVAAKGAKSVLFITLGTGIGRAYGKNNKILKIKQFEKAESWEKDYQKIKNKKELAEFLGEKLFLIADALNPEVVVIGGGVIKKKGYFEAIKNQLSNQVAKYEIRRSKLGKFAGAIGGAMLWKNNH